MVLCFVPFLVLFTIIFQKFSRHVHRTVNNARTDVNTYLSENLSGMKVTQIFNQEQRKMDEFLARSKRLGKTKMNRMFVFGIFRPMVYMLFVTSNLFLFYIGCKGYIKDTTFLGQTITSETVVAFYMYISRFFNPIQALAEQFDMLEQSFAAAEKIFTILDMVPEVVDEPDAIELKEMKARSSSGTCGLPIIRRVGAAGRFLPCVSQADRGLCWCYRFRKVHHPEPDLSEL